MAETSHSKIGVLLHGTTSAGELAAMCQLVEQSGFAELWLVEDCYMLAGFSGCGIALQATQRIPVGLGAVSSVVRHPAITAMEAATLMNGFPGRFRLAVGHGAPFWTRQMGLYPKSVIGSMRESVTSIKRLLNGEALEERGDYFTFNGIALEHPTTNPTVLIAAIGPKSIELAAEISDGLLVSVLAGPKYLGYVADHLDAPPIPKRQRQRLQVPVYVLACVDRDRRKARAWARQAAAYYLGVVGPTAMTTVYGIDPTLTEMLERGGADLVEREMPDEWLDWLTVAGEPDEVAERIHALFDAGATSVNLTFTPADTARAQLELTASEVLPKFT